MNTWINLNALWKITVVGTLTNAGIPALFTSACAPSARRPAPPRRGWRQPAGLHHRGGLLRDRAVDSIVQ
ncbi:hypothetical protein [Kitasatospora sp. LaBMicrA B282]|uniref:hypothetical protein n=1 Tax=Kitasatospora sp. LaBMicrA B282 TaxID=3420949 RepID=UPI003D10F322